MVHHAYIFLRLWTWKIASTYGGQPGILQALANPVTTNPDVGYWDRNMKTAIHS
jgi:hypothetical protein